MNATERARRSDSLYYDTQVTNRRALCDMIAHLESDLAESKAENAKLRELVRDMCVWAYIDSDCDLEDRFADRMRELGIEEDA